MATPQVRATRRSFTTLKQIKWSHENDHNKRAYCQVFSRGWEMCLRVGDYSTVLVITYGKMMNFINTYTPTCANKA